MSKLRESWLKLLELGDYCDVTFIVGENEVPIKCHQLVLITRVPAVFSDCRNDFQNCGNTNDFVIKLPDVAPAAFTKILMYIYGEQFDMKNDVSLGVDLLYIAKKYSMASLIAKCVNYLTKNLKMDKAVDVLVKAHGKHDDVADPAGAFIVKHFAKLRHNKRLNRLEASHWIYLLQRQDLLLSEFIIFDIVHAWASQKLLQIKEAGDGDMKVTLKELLKEICPHIRFPTMCSDDFVDVVVPLNVLDKEVALDVLCYMNSAAYKESLEQKLPFCTDPRRPPAISPESLAQLPFVTLDLRDIAEEIRTEMIELSVNK